MNQEIFARILVVFSPHATRARDYFQKVRPEIFHIAREKNLLIHEIAIDRLPYFAAREKIAREILSGDLVVAAGGDGISQVVFDALNLSKKNAIFATIPLGHGNDLSRALNGRSMTPHKIFLQKIREFFPLEISFNIDQKTDKNSSKNFEILRQKQSEISSENLHNQSIENCERRTIFLASYITFGATTILTEFLNQENQRKIRQKAKSISPAFAIRPKYFYEISQRISQEKFPDFLISKEKISDDSVGFFVVSAAKNLLRTPKKLVFSREEFFFHHAKMSEKNLLQKIMTAGIWAAHFPGEITHEKILRFSEPENFAANIAGDNVQFQKIREITAKRSARAVKILAKK